MKKSFFEGIPQKIFYLEDTNKWITLLMAISVLIILLIVWYISTKIVITDATKTPNSKLSTQDSNPQTLQNRVTDYFYCPPGECATNIFTGIKRCPASENISDSIIYDVSSEVCSFKTSCSNPTIPYALLSDGSTDGNGICEDGKACRCLQNAQSPEDVTVRFDVENGTPFIKNNNFLNNYYINQTLYDKGDLRSYTSIPIDDPARQYWKLNPAYLQRVAGGCDFTEQTNAPINYTARLADTRNDSAGTFLGFIGIEEGIYNNEDIKSNVFNDYPYDGTNYKNLQVCFNRGFCKEGSAVYNVDNKLPQLFGQFTGNNLDSYYQDPDFYTVSCRNVNPCSDIIVPEESDYFPEFDKCLFYSNPGLGTSDSGEMDCYGRLYVNTTNYSSVTDALNNEDCGYINGFTNVDNITKDSIVYQNKGNVTDILGTKRVSGACYNPPIFHYNDLTDTGSQAPGTNLTLDSSSLSRYTKQISPPNSTGTGLYYPVYDPKRNKSICVRLKPLLLASVIPFTRIKNSRIANVNGFGNNISNDYSTGIYKIRIDASGKDFGHYKRVVGLRGYYWSESASSIDLPPVNTNSPQTEIDKYKLKVAVEYDGSVDSVAELEIGTPSIAAEDDDDIQYYRGNITFSNRNYGINNIPISSDGSAVNGTTTNGLLNPDGRINYITVIKRGRGYSYIALPRVVLTNYALPKNEVVTATFTT